MGYLNTAISYFDEEGSNANLTAVLKIVKRAMKKRADLQKHKLVFFTALGRGPALAYNMLEDPKIIAVTFPPSFQVMVDGKRITPEIPPKLRRFFDAVDIKVLRGRLPFDKIQGAESHNHEMELIKNVLSLFGGGFFQCVQAVLHACDCGEIAVGESVIGITGDCAAVITASNTERCFSVDAGLVISEIICKPRVLTIARTKKSSPAVQEPILFGQTPEVPALGSKIIEGQVAKKGN
jgi:hypothetical protein